MPTTAARGAAAVFSPGTNLEKSRVRIPNLANFASVCRTQVSGSSEILHSSRRHRESAAFADVIPDRVAEQ